MRHYEVMVILDPDLEERTVAPSLDTFLNVVKQSGGTVDKVDIWGRRRLSFEINKKAEGIYAAALQDQNAAEAFTEQANVAKGIRDELRIELGQPSRDAAQRRFGERALALEDARAGEAKVQALRGRAPGLQAAGAHVGHVHAAMR